MDSAELTKRYRMSELLSACRLQVGSGEVPNWISEQFCSEHLNPITTKAGLPAELSNELVTIAVFLDAALSLAPVRAKAPKDVRRELAALKRAHRTLLRRLSAVSKEARFWLYRVDEMRDHVGQLSYEVSNPPISTMIRNLKDFESYLTESGPTGRPGPKRSPKFYAVLLLSTLLQEHRGAITAEELTYLAEAVVEPIAEYHGDEASLGDIIQEVFAGRSPPLA